MAIIRAVARALCWERVRRRSSARCRCRLRNGVWAAPPRCGGEPGCEGGGAARAGQQSRCVRAAAGSRAGPVPGPAGRAAAAAASGMGERRCALLVRVLVLQAAWAVAGGQVRYSVPEEAKAGTVLGRLAQDLGLEAGEAEARRLRLVAQGRRASVEVSGASGALVLSSRLDREELCGKSAPCALRLEVLVERPLRVFHVELEVTDINDNAPVFPAARKNLSITEFTTLPGSRFPLEGASDADIGANAQLTYTLSPSEHFSLDLEKTEEDGESLFLVLTKSLDRETIPVHRLVLTASDGGRPSLTGTMELVISVLDVNDNMPQFNLSVYKVQLPENAERGALVIRLNATDLDEELNSDISYSLQILSPQDGRDVFGIDRNSGEIRLKEKIEEDVESLFLVLTKPLDRETIPVHRLLLAASDGGRPSLTGTMELVISVLDVNDNVPQFNQSVYKVQLPENAERGALVIRLNATDLDEELNSDISYSLQILSPQDGRDVFGIDRNSGEIRLKGDLDFEDVSLYRLQVDATDKGTPPLSGHCKVVLEVLDVNDNAPEVWVKSLSVPVSEDASVGTVVALLSVSDRDSGANGRVRCWVWPASPFGLEATFAGSYSLVLRELGAGAASAATNVWLVVAICAVSSLFLLAVVLYGASRWAPRAAVLSGPGPTTLVCASEVGSWSYSQRHSRSLCVADGAGKSDLMVFSPNFPPPPPPPGPAAKDTQPEPSAFLDTAVRASFAYALGSGTACGRLRPGAAESPAVSAGGAARAGQQSRCVRAAAGSRAGPVPGPAGRAAAAAASGMGERRCALLVRVLVLQAAWAVAGGQVRYSVPEEAKAGTVLGRLAQDLGLEAGEAEARRLRLVAQGRRASVEVSGASGALVLSSRLDREELCGKSAPCALRLEVLVERPLRVFHVELEVTDINDNAPVFPAARKNLSLSENSPPGFRIPLEGASDADIGANAQLSYSLSPSEYFGLEVKSKDENKMYVVLVLTKSLDRETIPVHRLVLTASDGGRPSLTGTMELLISVLDANDNPPHFNQSVYKVDLPENTPPGTLFFQLTATDKDEGTNREIYYSFSDAIYSKIKDLFRIDEKSGEIRTAGELDFEDIQSYDLEIEARDKGTPPLSGHCSVELK
ncbi:PREDICTED: protocadherin alpha-2-like, partial [Pseudopodoces humilis]|uniref:protocadherin alpha-2-like n=1 Tax=Pseudopodoces humilis TaxID=181119 RepID=UPI000395854F